MPPKLSHVNLAPEKILKTIDVNNFFSGLEPKIYTKQYVEDFELNKLKERTTNFAFGNLSAKTYSDPVYKLLEVFPAYFSEMFGDAIPGLDIQKADTFLDVQRGVDFMISLDNFSATLGIDVTGNPTKNMAKISFKPEEFLFDYGKVLNQISVNKLDTNSGGKFLNINLYLDVKEFEKEFFRLASNTNLNKKEIYLALLKKFYIDKITRFMCDYVSNGKTISLTKLKRYIVASNSNKKLYNSIILENLTERQLTVLDILLRLDINFYNSKEVSQLISKNL